MTSSESTKPTMTNPPEMTFKVLRELELWGLVKTHLSDLGLTLENLSLLCKWWNEDVHFSLHMNCTKTNKPVLKFSDEEDFIKQLINQEVLPEGNYLVVINH